MDFIKDFIVILVVVFGATVSLVIVGDLLTGKASPSVYFKYVDFDGHQYVMYACNNRSGITHSPKCTCLKKNEETGNAQEGM